MKRPFSLYFVLILVVMFSSCIPTGSATTPIAAETQPSSEIPNPSTPVPTPSLTLVLHATLEPEKAKEAIRTFLQTPRSCLTPCFWGIYPQKTTINEAKDIFGQLGFDLKHTGTQNGVDFYAFIYDAENGLRVSPILAVQNEIVTSINVGINPENQQAGIAREWLVYSPEILINQYGPPSRVNFSVDRGPHDPGDPYVNYFMTMYFDRANMIVSYEYGTIDPEVNSLRVCPLTDQFSFVRIWLGTGSAQPSFDGIPLEQATSMTIKDFSGLMLGPINEACLILKEELFP